MDYRGKVGPEKLYDFIGAQQFCVMFNLGLREQHKLIDLGCGSLRGGRLFIPYLNPGNYYGIEPNATLVSDGLQNELGHSILRIKQPHFYDFDDFEMSKIGIEAGFILAQSILSHSGVDIVEKILHEASHTLTKNGKFVATFFEGAEGKKRGWLGHDITTYTIRFMKFMAKKNGLKVKRLSEICPGVNHPVGQKWIVFSHLG